MVPELPSLVAYLLDRPEYRHMSLTAKSVHGVAISLLKEYLEFRLLYGAPVVSNSVLRADLINECKARGITGWSSQNKEWLVEQLKEGSALFTAMTAQMKAGVEELGSILRRVSAPLTVASCPFMITYVIR